MKMPLKAGIFVLLLVLMTANLSARTRDIKFDRISIDQGLSQSSVIAVLQDRRGFMWFGTTDGLNKYDGYGFTIYRNDPDAPDSLSSNLIRAICEDKTGTLWIGTDRGLNRFDPARESFRRYEHDPDNPESLSDNNLWSVYEDRSGILWIGTGGGLDKFDPQAEKFTHYRHDPNNSESLSHNEVYVIYEDRSGILWIGTNGGGLNAFDRDKETVIRYQHDPDNPDSLSGDHVYAIYEDRRDTLWIATYESGVNAYDKKTGSFKRYLPDSENPGTLNHKKVRGICEDNKGVLWFSTRGGGLNAFDRSRERFVPYLHEPANPKSLSTNDLAGIYKDSTGILWIGTYGGGVCNLDYQRNKFAHYLHDPQDSGSLSSNDVTALYEDRNGMLWAGTFGEGLSQFDRQNDVFRHYRHEPDNPESLSNNQLLSVYEDKSGTIWVGTLGGLNKFDRIRKSFTHYRHDPENPESLSQDSVTAILEDKDGFLWAGTWNGGLNRFDREREIFTRYPHDSQNPNSLSHNRVRALFEDSEGILWIGTNDGLNSFDKTAESFTRYFHNAQRSDSLSHNQVRSIYEDSRGILWVGTSGGLNRFNRKIGTFFSYREKDGLPNDVIYGIQEDDQGNLWLSTNQGLSKFDPRQNSFKNYDVYDGLQSNEFNTGVCCKSRTGELFFGGINGFNGFYPDEIKDNPHVPRIVLTEFQKFNKKVQLDRPLSEISEIKLSYKDYVFSFEFAALDYSAPEKNLYAYMLEGFEKDWNRIDAQKRFATYTNLSGGEYFFKVKGSNQDGVWNEAGVSLKLIITPPWWETWQFRGLMAVLILGLPFAGYRWRIRSVERQRNRLEYQVRERTDQLERQKERILENEQKYRGLVEGIDEVIYRMSLPDGIYEYMSPASWKVFGYAAEDFYKDPLLIRKIIHPDFTNYFRCHWAELIVGHMPPTYEYKILDPADNERWILQSNKGIFDEQGNITAIEGICRNITELKQNQEALQNAKEAAESANRAKSAFLATMSHELRTPLNAILGYVQILKQDAVSNQTDGLNIIEQSGRHLFSLISDVLDLAKIESGRIELYETEFYLSAFLRNICEIIRIRAEQKGIEFCSDISGSLPKTVRGDERRIRQVLLNLLGNAVKFTDAGSVTLRVVGCGVWDCGAVVSCQSSVATAPNNPQPTTNNQHHNILFEVQDTGIGISPDDLNVIFDPFRQAGDPKRRAEGTGLGLAISRNLIELMGGSLQAESRSGSGSVFRFDLKLSSVAAETDRTAETSRRIIGIDGKAPKIFVVDDNRDNRAVLRDMLLPLGFEITETARAREALEKIENFSPDAVITDLIMPEMDGFELIRRIRQDPAVKDVVIIATSASVYEEDHRKSADAGSNAFLPKPVESGRLFEILQQFLNIEWLYEPLKSLPKNNGHTRQPEFVLPPAEHLQILCDFADTGDIEGIRDCLKELAASDETLLPFAYRLQELAKNFKLNEISRLLEEYMNYEAG